MVDNVDVGEEFSRVELRKVKDIVLSLLESEERCRNDDKWLTYKVMRCFTKIYIPFQDFDKMPSFETIKRVRAKIQNVDKKFPPTDEKVIKRRSVRQKVFSDVMVDRG